MLVFTNTLTQKKESFLSKNSKKVTMYVCGITPYDYPHIGHGRCYVTFDLVYRLLTFIGYEVIYARNFTDIDDKILKRAKLELGDESFYKVITDKYIDAFGQDMKSLNCITPSFQPRVTLVIDQIIQFTQKLVENGSAYVADGSVYFRINTFRNYGNLSKQKIEDLQSGARVDLDECKENPLDFALWKKDDDVGFDSPWGKGRPGWHIECSAMVQDIFHDGIDIHGGGMDLMFPHHENEIAQSESLYHQPLAKYWLHNAFVRINKEKMSKSLGNFFTLQDVFEKFDPMIVRFYFLKHNYRGPLDFTFEDLASTGTAYKRLVTFFADTLPLEISLGQLESNKVLAAMVTFLEDDLNTSGAFGVLFESLFLLQLNKQAKAEVKYFLMHVMGLTLEPLRSEEVAVTSEIQDLINQREVARVNKDWKQADMLRNQLKALGFDAHDNKLK